MRYLFILLLYMFATVTPAQAAKCMLVLSYHKGYAWNDGVQRGVESTLKDQCNLRIFYMDTKRHQSREYGERIARQAMQQINDFQPDVLIAADDNASRYLVSKYYRNADLPIVFCAVNWDVSKYGYPYKNVTGMIEVAPIQPVFEVSRKILGKINKVAYIGAKTFTEKKNAHRVVDILKKQGVTTRVHLVSSADEWKEVFIRSQSADLIMLGSNAGISNWGNDDIASFVKTNAKKLIITNHNWMAPYSMYAMTKVPEEQGEWAAEAALAIIKGLSPSKIPIRVNRKWQTYINTPLLHKVGLDTRKVKFDSYIEVDGRSTLDGLLEAKQ
jgi:ABC-type uncharacterized transport system substrate-binding protein